MAARRGRVLLLGGTGAMGANLSGMLAECGWEVVVTSRSRSGERGDGVRFERGDAHDRDFLRDILLSGWDAVVDFMSWTTAEFSAVRDVILASCSQYVYLSSYRVFADSPVITEGSPRLLDVCEDAEYVTTDEYALAKARQEDMLRSSGGGSWTIVRPAITYDRSGRFQLCTLESNTWLRLALAGHAVPLASEMLPKQTTMTRGRDVALMISRLIGNPVALGEDYNACTSKHQSWDTVVEVYRSVIPLRVREVRFADYVRAAGAPYQCRYDRMLDRVVDNSKVLRATGVSESELMGVEEGLSRELECFLCAPRLRIAPMRKLGRLDRLGEGVFGPVALRRATGAGVIGMAKYYAGCIVGL